MGRRLKLKKTKHLSRNGFDNCLTGTVSKRIDKHLNHCTHCKNWLRHREKKREELAGIITDLQSFSQRSRPINAPYPDDRPLREELAEEPFPRLLSPSEWSRLKWLAVITSLGAIVTIATINIIICPTPSEGIPIINWISIAIFTFTVSWVIYILSQIDLDRDDVDEDDDENDTGDDTYY